ncbi:XRE family transcriptional regulator [Clostridium perfringens]|nr:XRE family transcriptional regulator [Clostridium perfringens]
MFTNLQNALYQKGITMKSLAEFLQVTEKTARNKIQGKTEFTLSEVKKISMYLFPEYAFSYLFQPDSDKRVS